MGEDWWEGVLADGVLTYERQLERRVAWLEQKVMRLIYMLNVGIGAVFGGLVFVLSRSSNPATRIFRFPPTHA